MSRTTADTHPPAHDRAHGPLPVHLVGSLPRPLCDDPATAMDWYLRHRGNAPLTALPYDRDPRWIIDWLTHHLVSLRALDQVRGGESRGYDDMPYYRVRPGHRLRPEDVGLARLDQAEAAFAALERLQVPDMGEPLRVQVGIPNALDLALFAFGSVEAAREWMPTMQAAVLGEVAGLAARWGDRVQLQLETPAVLVSYNSTPHLAWPLLTVELTQQAAEIFAAAPHTRWVLHLCYGDLERVPVFTPVDLSPAVEFLNGLADLLPGRGVPMPIVHLPVASGKNPPPTNPVFFDALRHLRRGVDVIAGVVAEDHPDETREALQLTVDALGVPVVGISAACGYGRRTEDAAAANLELAAQLAAEWSGRPV
ncbi:hypothetical protein ALI22I_43235 [Saccharothrix sp. ALI-22-I]|uniref:hypothetical protein n=1 Tax=Saccharothrix sp. ALI-22-I TaxID=1933778 RepID=UPI0009CFD9DB|nr:hypothetical protein [Saccharothrix sp. ALI-22-I]ONI80206.1 hypothetical protein ALI22I_43235 [Saccharothrix sp. ALI-22-I]